MVKKMCEICRKEPATIPDRNIPIGRPIKRICSACHESRLRDDLKYILASYKKRNEK